MVWFGSRIGTCSTAGQTFHGGLHKFPSSDGFSPLPNRASYFTGSLGPHRWRCLFTTSDAGGGEDCARAFSHIVTLLFNLIPVGFVYGFVCSDMFVKVWLYGLVMNVLWISNKHVSWSKSQWVNGDHFVTLEQTTKLKPRNGFGNLSLRRVPLAMLPRQSHESLRWYASHVDKPFLDVLCAVSELREAQ